MIIEIKILPNLGDPQAKERIKLDAKADKKKTRGGSITKASFPFQLFCLSEFWKVRFLKTEPVPHLFWFWLYLWQSAEW